MVKLKDQVRDLLKVTTLAMMLGEPCCEGAEPILTMPKSQPEAQPETCN
jgi:hypothetical protein